MECKLKDSKSAFLTTYSYCKDNNLCLKDEWNYINRWCKTGWIPGWQIDIEEDCESPLVSEPASICPPITGKPDMKSAETNNILQSGAQCDVEIDATEAMVRVTFKNAENLGVLFNDYIKDEPITVPAGKRQLITVYNGNKFGPLPFGIAYSGANVIASGAIALTSAIVASTLY